ncbi:MAG: hypothetical protein ACLQVI_19505 [Polyangiaceae bacterium]|jgi:hypothetical protein
MSKHVSPLLGYNNNVRHKNRVFHIQTEDSGVKHPHIITHLFMDGGRILKSIKRSYAEHVGADKMQDTVKQMMKEQHKAMFIALRDGQFDGMLEDGQAAKDAAAKDKASAQAEAGKVEAQAAAAAAASPPPAAAAAAKPAAVPVPLESTDDIEMVPQTTRMPEMTLDMSPLERAAASGSASRQLNDLPPPPANMFRDKSVTGGAYRTSTPTTDATGKRASGPPPKKIPSGPPKKIPSAPPRGKAPSEGRYAAARPAAIFGQARPQQGSSIFGEDLISDKSLDEVILSYLAEDLEPAPEKKK